VVTLATNTYLPVDDGGIPHDATIGTYGKGVHPNQAFTLGPTEPDIDDCFISNTDLKSIKIDTRSEPLAKQVSAYHPESGIHLEVLSTEPAYQFYTGKYIEIPDLPGRKASKPRSGFCVEPSRYVNAVNQPEWRDQVVLKKGEKYGARIVYRAWKE
jgi:aldose 1-epimerase